MATCKFQFDFSGAGADLVRQIESRVTAAGGFFSGSAEQGSFALPTPVGKFQGSYRLAGQTILVDVADKPFFVPCSTIEAKLRQYVEEAR